MAVKISETNYKNFGKCLVLSNDIAELYVTLDVGPRIICYNLCGKENMMLEDLNRKLKNDTEEMKATFGEDKTWYIYGGHRFWISPEYITTYYPDNEPVEYKKTEKGVLFTPKVQSVTGLLCEFEVILSENSSDVEVLHTLTNCSGEQKEGAIWCLTVLDKGGVELLEWNDHKNGWLSNRNLILWDYTNMADSRVLWGKKYIVLKQDENADCPFKFGMDNKKGWAAYINKGQMFVKRFTHFEDETYPDNGCSYETYTCADFLEAETVAPLKKLAANEKTVHIEKWSLVDNVSASTMVDESSAEEFINSKIKV